ncbi:hypothetical protein [Nocardioides sp. SYSU D00038]|uniref:hypothetical protein n=1 Tax=Nocardioides sp. SYSU D00038 TaxID=2812554 RepID=UPI0019684928|nr:hypothetical protein [Nocardioides sp. SYSU D00038]
MGQSRGELRECALCGAAYLDAEKHQRFHDEIDEILAAVAGESATPASHGGRRRREALRWGQHG